MGQNGNSPLAIYDSISTNENLNAHKKKELLDSLISSDKNSINQDKLVLIYHDLLKSFYKKDVDISIDYALKIKAIGATINSQDEFYLKNDKNLVNLYYIKGTYHKSILHGKEFLIKYPEETVRQALIYRTLGNSFSDLGDFNEAISHYNKAIYILKRHKEFKEEGRTLINLLEVYVKIDNKSFKEDVFESIERFDVISKENEFSKSDILKKELNAGAYYDGIADYENAKFRYEKSLRLSRELGDSLHICNSLINLGIANRKENKLQESRKLFNTAITFAKHNYEKKASLFNNIADLYKEEKNYEQALIYYNNAITEFLQIEKSDIFKIPSTNTFLASENKVDLLGYTVDKANILLLTDNKELESKYLQLALELYAISDQILDAIYFESREDFSKLFWREEASDFYLNATEVAYKLNKPENAFYYIEKSKALLLLENITTSNAKVLANLPEHLINREFELTSDIKKAEEKLLSSKKNNQGNQSIDHLKNDVFSKKQSYVHFIDSLEIAYPSYYSFKKKLTVFKSNMVRELLTENQMVLQYQFNLNRGFVVLLTKSSEAVFRLENIEQIHETLDQYSDLISRPFVDHKDQERFKEISHKLFVSLFPFLKNNKELYINKKIIIIPDTRLNYIPFESLVVNDKRNLSESYLLNFCEISYAYSYSSLKVSYKDDYEKDFFAICPSSFKDNSLSRLLISQDNVGTIETIFDTQMISEENATKQRFLDEYGKSKVVHVSTHGGILNNKPWISFNDEKLMLSDIYFNNQKANLVVLSACKTSHGEHKKGEGVMSIARAFINSGSKSVVSSLWDINQQSTNEIITTFYTKIKEGNSKSEALRNAKLAYIKNHKNTSEASPFYWSSLVLTGDTSSVFASYKTLWYILLAICVLIAIVFMFKKYNHYSR